MTTGILLRYGKTIKTINLDKDISVNKLDISLIDKVYTKGIGNISRECDYEWDDVIISIFSWTNGKEKYINQHDLPPPIDNELYYGDIIIIKHVDNVISDFTEEEYNRFYEESFGGFDDIVSDESISSDEDPTQSDLDFIASDNESSGHQSTSEEEAETSDNYSDSEELSYCSYVSDSDTLEESMYETSKSSDT